MPVSRAGAGYGVKPISAGNTDRRVASPRLIHGERHDAWDAALAGGASRRGARMAPGPSSSSTRYGRGKRLLPVRRRAFVRLPSFGHDVDGALAAGVARVRGHVETDALPDLQHLETAIGHRGVVEKEFAARFVVVGLDKPETAVAERPDRTRCHRVGLPSPALLAPRHGGTGALAGACSQPVI